MLATLAALTPLGLLASGSAWGEWSLDELRDKAGYVPPLLAGTEQHGWRGLNILPDYLGDRGPLGYILAAVIGIALVAITISLLGRILFRKRAQFPNAATPALEAGTGLLPDWLQQSSEGSISVDRTNRRRLLSKAASAFSERNLSSLAESARHGLLSDNLARSEGFLQRFDPRAKLLACLAMVAVISVLHSLWMLIFFSAAAIALAALSRIPPALFLKRVWLAVPMFAGAVVLPAALNIVTPGRSVFVLTIDPYLSITDSGLRAVGLLALRIGAAMSFVALLPLTTRWQSFLAGLRALGLSRAFVGMLGMTHRYASLFIETATEALTARRSRAFGVSRPSHDRRYAGRLIGVVLQKAHHLAGEVHSAMLARGWTGEARTIESLRFRTIDSALIGAAALIVGLAILGARIG
jgi:cobalt ECF transporter T component CbiQ